MRKVLVSMPGSLVARMKAAIPLRQRSKVISGLIEKEIERREKCLYECALAVENDRALKKEMKEWAGTLKDGLDNESW